MEYDIQAMKYPCNEYNKYIACATGRGYVRWANVVQKFAQISLLWVYSHQPALNSEENNLSNLSAVKTKHIPIGLSHITALLDHCEDPIKGLASSNQLWNALSPTPAIENIGKMTKDGAYTIYSTPWMMMCDVRAIIINGVSFSIPEQRQMRQRIYHCIFDTCLYLFWKFWSGNECVSWCRCNTGEVKAVAAKKSKNPLGGFRKTLISETTPTNSLNWHRYCVANCINNQVRECFNLFISS